MSVPMLLLGAGADFMSSPEDFHAFDAELGAAGVEHTAVLYDGLPHAFFDSSADDHRQECDDAWHRVLHFIDEHTAQRQAVGA
ncbi:dienelactone hydrolase family protein [Catenulispora yoronensis]